MLHFARSPTLQKPQGLWLSAVNSLLFVADPANDVFSTTQATIPFLFDSPFKSSTLKNMPSTQICEEVSTKVPSLRASGIGLGEGANMSHVTS